MPEQSPPPIAPLGQGPRRPGLGFPLWLVFGLVIGLLVGHPVWGAALGALVGVTFEAVVRR